DESAVAAAPETLEVSAFVSSSSRDRASLTITVAVFFCSVITRPLCFDEVSTCSVNFESAIDVWIDVHLKIERESRRLCISRRRMRHEGRPRQQKESHRFVTGQHEQRQKNKVVPPVVLRSVRISRRTCR